MPCKDEKTAVETANDDRITADDALEEALAEFGAAMILADIACIAAVFEGGLNPIADAACAAGLLAAGVWEVKLENAIDAAERRQSIYDIRVGEWTSCVDACPAWAKPEE